MKPKLEYESLEQYVAAQNLEESWALWINAIKEGRYADALKISQARTALRAQLKGDRK